MALPALAPVSALEVRLGLEAGSLMDADLGRATAALEDASALIRSASKRTWLAADGVTVTAPDEVVAVALQSAKRAYGNPEGLSQESVSASGYSASYADGRSSGVYLTGDERATVERAAKAAGGAWQGSVPTPSSYFDASATAVDDPWWWS